MRRYWQWRSACVYRDSLRKRGFEVRMPNTKCRSCGADRNRWCKAGCKVVDLADYR